jgi:hypothetical protein
MGIGAKGLAAEHLAHHQAQEPIGKGLTSLRLQRVEDTGSADAATVDPLLDKDATGGAGTDDRGDPDRIGVAEGPLGRDGVGRLDPEVELFAGALGEPGDQLFEAERPCQVVRRSRRAARRPRMSRSRSTAPATPGRCAPPDQLLDGGRFDLRHLLDEHLLVAVPRGHRLARRRTVRLAELAEDPFVVGSATAEETLMRASLPPGFRPRVDIVAADWTGKLGCVAAGLVVALVPALAIHATPADVALLRLHGDDASTRRIFAATTAGRSRPPAVDRFIADLEAAAGSR